jgi:DNA-binding SARP family transcriptional activator/tetratricopeptide (TPR) repeat protein
MDFRILGPLEVVSSDRVVELPGSKPRVLLALLLVRANHVVGSDRLAEDLWEGSPPESARATLQTYVSQLRKSLGLASLLTRRGGYVLEIEPAALDASRFERAFAALRTADEPTRVAANLSEALGLWRGPALTEFDQMLWAQPEIARLEGMRLSAYERLTDARLALGEHAALVDELESEVHSSPLREGLWSQLMLALYRCGRQSDALRAYGRLRRHLGEELGIEPSKELVRLEEAILLQKPDLDWIAPEGASLITQPVRDTFARPPVPVPLPATLRALVQEPFIGRVAELERLRKAWNAARAGDGRAVFVAGEPGIGKTRLIAELAVHSAEDGARVLYGRCDDDLGVPYQPWVESLQEFVRSRRPGDEKPAAKAGNQTAQLLPQLVSLVAGTDGAVSGDAETERYLAFSAVVDLVAEVCADGPVLLVLEDLHWADDPTLALLRRVLRSSPQMPLLVVCTYRASELSKDHALVELLAGLHREAGVERENLEGFGDAEIVVLLEAALGRTITEGDVALAHSLGRATAGNPFFTKEIIRQLMADGSIGSESEPARTPPWEDSRAWKLPQSVREVLGQRVRRLGNDLHDVLTTASTLGHQFDLDLLAGVVGRPADELVGVLDRAGNAALITEVEDQSGRFAFAHSLIQQTLYAELGTARRQWLHRRAGEVLEALERTSVGPPRVRELAHHWLTAWPADAAKALRYTVSAAEEALSGLAPEDAVRWYRHGLDLCPPKGDADDALRCDLLIGLGTAQRQAEDQACRETLLDAARLARQLGDTDRLVRAALLNPYPFTPIAALDADRIAVLEAALNAIGDVPSADRAELLATLAAELMWSADLSRRRELATEALEIARTVAEPRTLVNVLNLCFHALYVPDNLSQRTAWAEEALQAADATSDPLLRWIALDLRTWTAFDVGDFAELDRFLEEQEAITERLGQARYRIGAAMLRASRVVTTGSAVDAEAALKELRGVAATADPSAATLMGATLTLALRWRSGHISELAPLMEQSTAEQPAIPASRSALAQLYVELGRDDDARTLLDAEVADAFQRAPYDRIWLGNMTRWSSVSAELGDRPSAAILYPLLAPFQELIVGPQAGSGEGSVAYQLGRLASTLRHYDQGLEHFDAATAINERVGAAYWAACTHYEKARCLGARDAPGDLELAGPLLQQALTIATKEGYALIEHRIRQSLATP